MAKVLVSFDDRRRRIANEVRQQVIDLDHWNRTHPNEQAIAVDDERDSLANSLRMIGLDLDALVGEARAFVPSCVRRTGKECRDCVECLARIPSGKTCASCAHAETCKAIWGVHSPETQYYCSWVPSRYTAAAQ